MASGPGKHDDIATVAREVTGASAVIVVVLDGVRGHGFSVQMVGVDRRAELARVLRSVAEQMESEGTS